jgi:hypothetical protein
VDFIPTVDPFKVNANGSEVVVDQRTFTLAERRASRAALVAMSSDDDIMADEVDALAALTWIVLRRANPALTLDDVFSSMTVADLAAGETVEAADLTDRDDDPEA